MGKVIYLVYLEGVLMEVFDTWDSAENYAFNNFDHSLDYDIVEKLVRS